MDSPFQSYFCSLLLHSSFNVKQNKMDQVEMQGNELTGYYDGNSFISVNFIINPRSESVVSGAPPHRELVTLHTLCFQGQLPSSPSEKWGSGKAKLCLLSSPPWMYTEC